MLYLCCVCLSLWEDDDTNIMRLMLRDQNTQVLPNQHSNLHVSSWY